MSPKPVVLKIGGSAITEKSRRFSVIREVLEAIAEDVARYVKEGGGSLVIVHGGGSFGHPLALEHKRRNTLHTPDAFVEIGGAMKELNRIVVEELRRAGVNAYGFQTSSHFMLREGEVYKCWLEPILASLDLGVVPVLYGDIVVDAARGFEIISGDTIASLLLRELECVRGCFATSVDGVYDSNSRVIPVLRLKSGMRHEATYLGGAEGADVTGGMGRKLAELVKYCRPGTEIVIFNGRIPGNTYKALSGVPVPNSTIVKIEG